MKLISNKCGKCPMRPHCLLYAAALSVPVVTYAGLPDKSVNDSVTFKIAYHDTIASSRFEGFSVMEGSTSESQDTAMDDVGRNDLWTLLNNRGLSFSITYKSDFLGNVSGGMERKFSYLHNIDAACAIDAEKLIGWKGADFVIHGMSNNGGCFSGCVGDAQVISNIEAPEMTKIYQLLYQQSFLENSISFSMGLYDVNSEFYVTESSALFLNSSFGVGKDFSQTGRCGPSIFPNPSASVRVLVQPEEWWSFRCAVIDAVPGRDDNPNAAAITLSSDDGALVIGEVAFNWDGNRLSGVGTGKLSVGAWLYSAEFEEVNVSAMQASATNRGVYLMAEQQFSFSGERGLSMFARAGIANGRINQFDWSASAGGVLNGTLPGRELDQLGVGITYASSGREYRTTMAAAAPVADGELVFELTYRVQVAPWFVVQPDAQYIIHPGAGTRVGNAIAIGARAEIGF